MNTLPTGDNPSQDILRQRENYDAELKVTRRRIEEAERNPVAPRIVVVPGAWPGARAMAMEDELVAQGPAGYMSSVSSSLSLLCMIFDVRSAVN